MIKPKRVKCRYLAFKVNHSVLLVDTTAIIVPKEILPPEGKAETLLSLRFQSWQWAEKFLLEGGASQGNLDKTGDLLRKTGLAVVQISE